jgi:hypothetical protein
MPEEPKDPAQKMRNLLKGGRSQPMTQLPRRGDSPVDQLPQQAVAGRQVQTPAPAPPAKATARPTPASKSDRRFRFGPAFWTAASLISLFVNLALVITLTLVLINLERFEVGNLLGMGDRLLGGLYSNFEKMDRAHITTNVRVNTTIPVKFDLQLNQGTSVVLSQDVTIDNAVVTVKTGGLNITNALTTIVLPQGTTLPIVLNLTVPVDASVPVTLDVPVDIPLNQTDLHEPFVGLQEVVEPFYCMVNQGAVNLQGQSLCR